MDQLEKANLFQHQSSHPLTDFSLVHKMRKTAHFQASVCCTHNWIWYWIHFAHVFWIVLSKLLSSRLFVKPMWGNFFIRSLQPVFPIQLHSPQQKKKEKNNPQTFHNKTYHFFQQNFLQNGTCQGNVEILANWRASESSGLCHETTNLSDGFKESV